jgi:hypothetical protein
MKGLIGFLLLVALIGVYSAAAQDEQCVEYHSFDTVNNVSLVHQVNLDTGAVSTYPQPDDSAVTTDEPFSADMESNDSPRFTATLTLTDNRTGISVVFTRTATSYNPYWSPDGIWLAYVEWDIAEDVQYLRLYNAETGEVLSTTLEGERYEESFVDLIWSPNGQYISASLFIENGDTPRSEVQVYSVPDLSHLSTYQVPSIAPTVAFVHWSPSGNYFAVDATSGDVHLVDTTSWEIITTEAEGVLITYEYLWSPDETYLAIVSYNTDSSRAYHNLNVLNMQGELIFETMVMNRLGTAYWVNDQRLLVPSDEVDEALNDFNDYEYDLTLFDLQTGEQSLVLEQAVSYRLSSDHRYLVEISNTEQFIKIYDLSQSDEFLIDTVTVAQIMFQYLWREDRLELIVLFEDMSLRAYNLETKTWRDIASDIPHPGDDVGIYQAACSE